MEVIDLVTDGFDGDRGSEVIDLVTDGFDGDRGFESGYRFGNRWV